MPKASTYRECEAFQPTIVLSRRDNEESVTAESNVSMIVKILPQNNTCSVIAESIGDQTSDHLASRRRLAHYVRSAGLPSAEALQ